MPKETKKKTTEKKADTVQAVAKPETKTAPKEKKVKATKPKCQAKTKDGKACKRSVSSGSDKFCATHIKSAK
jgi:hypothetical protein